MMNVPALALLQDAPASPDHNLLIIFIGILAVALLIQGIGVLIGGLAAAKALKALKEVVDDLHGKATPILTKTNHLVDELGPKVRAATENVTQTTYTVREKVDEIGETVAQLNRTVNDLNGRARLQVAHLDRMVSSTLATTEEITSTVVQGIRAPVRQVAGVVAGLKTGVERLIRNYQRGPAPRDLDL